MEETEGKPPGEELPGPLPGDIIYRPLRVRRRRGLRRVLGIPALYSIGYGDVGSSIFYALGFVSLYTLGATPLAIGIAGLFFVCTVLAYAECSTLIPKAGGSCSFARNAYNDLLGFIAGWALLLDYIVTFSISILFAATYLKPFLPFLVQYPYNSIAAAIVGAILITLNILGIKESANTSIVLCLIANITQLLIILTGLIVALNFQLLLEGFKEIGNRLPTRNFVYGVSIAMAAYIGIESISQLSEEAKRPGRTVPYSMLAAMATVLILYPAICSIGLSAMPPQDFNIAEVKAAPKGEQVLKYMPIYSEDGTKVYTSKLCTHYLDNPLGGIANSLHIKFKKFLIPWVGILGFVILFVAANAGLIGASRLSYAMGGYKYLPAFLYRLHPRFRTPTFAILLFGGISILLIVGGEIPFLADLYNFGAMLAFTFAHLALIGLRIKEPNLERPFKVKPNIKIRGYEIPITSIIGGLATATVWVIVVITHKWGRIIGFSWLLFGFIIYLSYRIHNKLPIVKRVEVAD